LRLTLIIRAKKDPEPLIMFFSIESALFESFAEIRMYSFSVHENLMEKNHSVENRTAKPLKKRKIIPTLKRLNGNKKKGLPR
jgi:hypothetical protein